LEHQLLPSTKDRWTNAILVNREICCGQAVVKHSGFAELLRKIGKEQATCVDMESIGFLYGCSGVRNALAFIPEEKHRFNFNSIIIRAISDRADENKTADDNRLNDVNRMWAMYNAANCFACLLQHGLISSS
jgi:hypothetical protein